MFNSFLKTSIKPDTSIQISRSNVWFYFPSRSFYRTNSSIIDSTMILMPKYNGKFSLKNAQTINERRQFYDGVVESCYYSFMEY